jgi:hypothetical protein
MRTQPPRVMLPPQCRQRCTAAASLCCGVLLHHACMHQPGHTSTYGQLRIACMHQPGRISTWGQLRIAKSSGARQRTGELVSAAAGGCRGTAGLRTPASPAPMQCRLRCGYRRSHVVAGLRGAAAGAHVSSLAAPGVARAHHVVAGRRGVATGAHASSSPASAAPGSGAGSSGRAGSPDSP